MYPNLCTCDLIAIDSETTGLDIHANDRLFGFSISTDDGRDFYWDVRQFPGSLSWLKIELTKYRGEIICHNLSFDYQAFSKEGIDLGLHRCHDTCILACLINEHEVNYSLDYLAKKYTKVTKKGDELYSEMAAIFGGRATKNVQMKRIADAPVEIVAPYAMADTRATLELFLYQQREIEKQKLHKIVQFEESVTPYIIKAEMQGVRVDIPAAELSVVELDKQVKVMQRKLDDVVGFKCNVNANAHMQKIFEPKYRNGCWYAKDGTPLPMTGAGKASLAAGALRNMVDPNAAMVLELRSIIKTRDTFMIGHVLESAHNGRVYPTINQTKGDEGGTGTGRLSYVAPALQQIPDRNKKVAEIVKKVFLPEEGHVWVDADKASFEVRIFAHLVGTPDIVQKYADNPETDFHQYVADLTGLVRNATYSGQPNAKQLNLSMIFNQGDGTTAETMGMPWSWESFYNDEGKEVTYKKPGPEARQVIDMYHSNMPGVKILADGAKRTAEQRGYIFTRRGRHLRFPNGFKSYKASGLLIQATSADENKQTWLEVNSALEGTGGLMLLNTHDSYSMSLPEDDCERIARRVKEYVERDRGLKVPLILEVQKPGANWWDSKSSERWM